MAKPRVFISSTYYDLKYLRSSLDVFIESLGFHAVLSENGDIAYAHDRPLDESCYKEAGDCDICVLIIGGRYGSSTTEDQKKTSKRGRDQFFERYESITKGEYQSAVRADIPVYILIERAVYAEYFTYLENKDNSSIRYAHVDSINVFRFIEEILSQRRNNPVQPFDEPSDIEDWLREQWAGRFRDLLRQRTSQQQLASLSSQVQILSEVSQTLKTYLEQVISTVAPESSKGLIESEAKRLMQAELEAKIAENPLITFLTTYWSFTLHDIIEALRQSDTLPQFLDTLSSKPYDYSKMVLKLDTLESTFERGNSARALLGLPPWPEIRHAL